MQVYIKGSFREAERGWSNTPSLPAEGRPDHKTKKGVLNMKHETIGNIIVYIILGVGLKYASVLGEALERATIESYNIGFIEYK